MADQKPTIVETRGSSSNVGLMLLALAIIIAAGVGFMYYQNEKAESDAVSTAAGAVSDAADTAKDAVKPGN